MKQILKNILLATPMVFISAISFATTEVNKAQNFSSTIEAHLDGQIVDLEKKAQATTDKESKHKLHKFFKNVRTAKKAFKEFSKNNPAVVVQYQQALESLKAERLDREDAGGQVEYFYQASQNKVKFGFAEICEMANTDFNILPLNIHFLIFGWAAYPSCNSDHYISYITFGPGLEFVENGTIGIVCALGKPADKEIMYNVGARGSASLGFGVNAAIAVGQNGICLAIGYNAKAFGASAGLTLLSVE